MSSTQEGAMQRPKGAAPQGTKERMGAVLAYAGDRIYRIPEDVAKQYEVSGDERRRMSQCVAPIDAGSDDEVGGRHAVLLVDGTVGYHSDWLVGPYVWISDGNWYQGPHWHPNRYSPLAYDGDNG
jgi:hypothetical protein